MNLAKAKVAGLWPYRQTSKMRAFKILWLLLVVVALIICGLVFQYQQELSISQGHNQAGKIFTVKKGMTLEETLSALQSAGIIRNALALRMYIKLTGKSPVVKAGDYTFVTPLTALEALSTLEAGGIQPIKLTVIEGWSRFDIADAMVKIPSLKLASRTEALKLMDNVALIRDLDTRVSNLEGYLFPDTYFVQSDTRASDLIKEMVKRFRQILGKVVAKSTNPKGLNVHEAVTAASIVETEAKLDKERPIVASVIFNRLKIHMPLAMDSTIVYASKVAGKWKGDGIVYLSDLNLKSLYNTRKYPGLPPGPVASPGASSLQAVLNPASTSFIYYVRDPDRNDGAHTFYSDAQSFEVGVAKLRRWEASQKARGLR